VTAETEAAAALQAVTAALPEGGEPRPGQVEMATAVAGAVGSGHHLVVQAGTGTGKSLAYLVPAILSGRRTVVATATKALQDQLATKDLPFLDAHLGRPFTFAVVKGRSNYLCLQRVREVTAGAGSGRLELGEELSPAVHEQVRRLAAWAPESQTGDRSELDWEPLPKAWEAVSVTSEQCPGAVRCPLGEPCFAEVARRRAAESDVVVVNTHLYGMHLAAGGSLLPEHDLVVLDECHQLEDVISSTAGLSLGPGRFSALSRVVGSVLADDALVAGVAAAGARLSQVLAPHVGARLPRPLPVPVADALAAARARLDDALAALRGIETPLAEVSQRKVRAQKQTSTLADDVSAALALPDGHVAWVEGGDSAARLEVAPIDVGPTLAAGIWAHRTAVLTSATVPLALPERIGLPSTGVDVLDVGSPFDYERNALLYCAAHLPDPRHASFGPQSHDELHALIEAAGGRTLALFTSWRAVQAAAEALAPRLPYRVLVQGELPTPALVRAFAAEETTCLFATTGCSRGSTSPGRPSAW
jgi:ATP-dependent DNA helicase DinG